ICLTYLFSFVLSLSYVLLSFLFFLLLLPSPRSALFPYTTLFRSHPLNQNALCFECEAEIVGQSRDPAVLDHGLRFEFECRDHRRSEEHTSELQSRENLVCRLLLEKKKKKKKYNKNLKKIHLKRRD